MEEDQGPTRDTGSEHVTTGLAEEKHKAECARAVSVKPSQSPAVLRRTMEGKGGGRHLQVLSPGGVCGTAVSLQSQLQRKTI